MKKRKNWKKKTLSFLKKNNRTPEESVVVNTEFKCLKTDGVQCPQTAGENGKLFELAIFIKSILH